jgi:signal transduction histidine kinase
MLGEQILVGCGGMGSVPQGVAPSVLRQSSPSRDWALGRAQPWAELAALKRAQEAQAESIEMLVHELRSPVAASKAMVATLRYLHPEDAQIDDFLTRIEKRMDQLLDLVNGILDLSQAEAGQPLGQTTDLDLVAQTRAVCEPYREEADMKGLAMTVELPARPVRVRLAEQAFQLILSNLVSNAIKYTQAGSVRITLRQSGTWASLEVKDSGIGIPQEEICQLFTKFFRASNARQGPFPGTGLGLAGVRALVERFGGELEATSEEGVGSSFKVRLPLYEADAGQGVGALLHVGRNCSERAATVDAFPNDGHRPEDR